MKKFISRIVVLIMALVMIFSFGACGNSDSKTPADPTGSETNNPENPGEQTPGEDTPKPVADKIASAELVNKAIDAMLASEQVAVTGEVKYYVAEYDTTVVFDINATEVKTADGHDGRILVKSGQNTLTELIKKGDMTYEYEPEKNYYYSSYAPEFSIEAIAEQIKEALADFKGDEIIKKDGEYIIEIDADYGEQLQNFQELLAEIADVPLGDFVAISLGGETYTRETLIADINAIFAEDNTVADAVAAVDTALSHMMPDLPAGASVTVKTLFNGIAATNDVTANDVYEILKENFSGLTAPEAGATPYDYILSIFGDIPLDDLLGGFEMEEGAPLTSAAIIEMAGMYLDNDEATVGMLFDTIAMSVEQTEYFGMALALAGVTEDVYMQITDDGEKPLISVENVAKFVFGENKLYIKLVINENATIKSFDVTVKNNIGYKADENAEEVQFAKVDIDGGITFSYTGVAAITEPNGKIAPCFNAGDEMDVCDLPASGALTVPLYRGKGVTIENIKLRNSVIGEDMDYITVTDNAVTISEEGVKAIYDEVIYFGSYVYLALEYKVDASEEYPHRIELRFECEDNRVPKYFGVYENGDFQVVLSSQQYAVIIDKTDDTAIDCRFSIYIEEDLTRIFTLQYDYKDDEGYHYDEISGTIEPGKITLTPSAGEGEPEGEPIVLIQTSASAMEYYGDAETIATDDEGNDYVVYIYYALSLHEDGTFFFAVQMSGEQHGTVGTYTENGDEVTLQSGSVTMTATKEGNTIVLHSDDGDVVMNSTGRH